MTNSVAASIISWYELTLLSLAFVVVDVQTLSVIWCNSLLLLILLHSYFTHLCDDPTFIVCGASSTIPANPFKQLQTHIHTATHAHTYESDWSTIAQQRRYEGQSLVNSRREMCFVCCAFRFLLNKSKFVCCFVIYSVCLMFATKNVKNVRMNW